MVQQLSKTYEPQETEKLAGQIWLQGRFFHATPPADGGPDGPPYTIMIPLPNVTGVLHMGHALNNTLQDILIRFKRMQGFNALWMPGTDHAGIATQSVVEKKIFEETGRTRHQIGREKLVKMIWQWKELNGNAILEQLKALGASCDWDRTRFTLDEVCSRAVRHTFVRLFKDGLIYRGKRLVNWDPVTQTALADDEVEHKTVGGNFYYIRYPLADGSGCVTVATTRPETMLADTAVAINPKDKRAATLVGRMVNLPLTGRQIPIIADDYVRVGEGTGFLKVTPAHDPNDYEIGLRHNLPMLNIFTPQAKVNENGGKYAGLDRYEAREAVVRDLQQQGLIEKIEPMEHQVGHSYRSGAAIEPYLSDQWFVQVGPLARPAIEAVENGQLRVHPKRYERTYLDWLYGVRDWCISRQLWWGHQIPVWYCRDCGYANCDIQDPSMCSKCGSPQLLQDPDVLDTWFSSALWPHSTLGWPEQTAELKFYYPTSTLVTSRDIITLWVSRMVMMGLYNTGRIPFTDVFIHGKILDGKGETMSKSKGNGIDPLDIIATYGADAMRFSLAMMTTESQDIRLPVIKDPQGRNVSDKFDIGRNFCTKLWNAGRFVLSSLSALQPAMFDADEMAITDRWILSRLAGTAQKAARLLDDFNFNEPLMAVYKFFWSDFCDWYLEWIKPRLQSTDQRAVAQNVLAFVFDQTLRLFHPFVPFITEGLFQKLNEVAGVRRLGAPAETDRVEALIIAGWPQGLERFIDEALEQRMARIQKLVRAIRDIRNQYNIAPSQKLTVKVKAPPDWAEDLNANSGLIRQASGLKQFEARGDIEKLPDAAAAVVDDMQVYVPGLVDMQAEQQRLSRLRGQIRESIERLESRLAETNFVDKARPDVVERARQRLAELKQQLHTVEEHLADLA
jgi:valyl-tRNA synthetase